MIVHQQRLYQSPADKPEETIGVLYINDRFYCYTLEDEKREIKVPKETRIFAGDYECGLRTYGGHHERYKKMFPEMHVGMIELLHVPQFTDILFHILNRESETDGCIGPGEYPFPYSKGRWMIMNSTKAYINSYPVIAQALLNKEKVIWQVRDE